VGERCLAAAKATKDRSAEGWALHQLGTRALCLGGAARARALLAQAVSLRESLAEDAAAAISRHNLEFVQAPIVDDADETAGTPYDDVIDGYTPPLFAASYSPAHRRTSSAAAPLAVLLLAVIAALVYLARADLAPAFWNDAAASTASNSSAPPADTAPRVPQKPAATPPLAAADPSARKATVLIFTARPGSIAVGGPTRLCYAVNDAVQARIDPGVGDVPPSSMLTCVRVAPTRTTTYALTAAGRDGQPVSQQVVIIVR